MTILFDLDNTLFDHVNSLKHAISAVREKFDHLQTFSTDELISKYNAALQSTYDAYLRGDIAHDQGNEKKVMTFFHDVGFPSPTLEKVQKLAEQHPEVSKRFAVFERMTMDQKAKAECIGVAHLVDQIITSEEAGVSKPNMRIFKRAATAMGVDMSSMIMVGDSIESDIRGALDAGISPVLYSPLAEQDETLIQGTQVPTIHHMSHLLNLLGIS
ncbi:HAD-like domain-containing protein [Plectosphaerella cucumerina]|uniref:HAD-like domain-containing protein n=1 Tax=Plectosphaerella cucumerina TaxID=40658 RepID=A0A8K0X314_9PEZI|nr:HAD-like domain-containing protein [Plectosphaerella cucumerina]